MKRITGTMLPEMEFLKIRDLEDEVKLGEPGKSAYEAEIINAVSREIVLYK